MLQLLFNGQYDVFVLVLVVIVLSLTLHEFGHGMMAKLLGDDTAERAGRLTLNPVSHIDPLGLAMVVLIGFGYARPVPFNVNKIKHHWGPAAVAAAGPLMNLLLAIVAINLLALGLHSDSLNLSDTQLIALELMALINLLLMLFNLIPLGPLDGHYIMTWLLPRDLSYRYARFNAHYGVTVFLALIVLSIIGVPIFSFLIALARALAPLITFV